MRKLRIIAFHAKCAYVASTLSKKQIFFSLCFGRNERSVKIFFCTYFALIWEWHFSVLVINSEGASRKPYSSTNPDRIFNFYHRWAWREIESQSHSQPYWEAELQYLKYCGGKQPGWRWRRWPARLGAFVAVSSLSLPRCHSGSS